MTESLATKADLEGTESALWTDLGKIEASLRGEMRELEQRMTIRFGGMMVVAVGLAAAAVRFPQAWAGDAGEFLPCGVFDGCGKIGT